MRKDVSGDESWQARCWDGLRREQVKLPLLPWLALHWIQPHVIILCKSLTLIWLPELNRFFIQRIIILWYESQAANYGNPQMTHWNGECWSHAAINSKPTVLCIDLSTYMSSGFIFSVFLLHPFVIPLNFQGIGKCHVMILLPLGGWKRLLRVSQQGWSRSQHVVSKGHYLQKVFIDSPALQTGFQSG